MCVPLLLFRVFTKAETVPVGLKRNLNAGLVKRKKTREERRGGGETTAENKPRENETGLSTHSSVMD